MEADITEVKGEMKLKPKKIDVVQQKDLTIGIPHTPKFIPLGDISILENMNSGSQAITPLTLIETQVNLSRKHTHIHGIRSPWEVRSPQSYLLTCMRIQIIYKEFYRQ